MCCWDVQVSLQQPVLHCRVVRWGLLVLSLSLSLFLFSLPSVSTSRAAAFSSVCRYYSSGCILMKVQWSERPSGAHHSQHLISGRQLPNVKLVVYSTTVLLLYTSSLQHLFRDLIYFADWDYCMLIGCYFWYVINQMVLWAGHSERMLPHILRLTAKRNKKTLKLIIGNILDIDQCVHRSVPNNQDDSWSMLPESEVYKHIIRLLHLYNLKQTSASTLQRVMDNFY